MALNLNNARLDNAEADSSSDAPNLTPEVAAGLMLERAVLALERSAAANERMADLLEEYLYEDGEDDEEGLPVEVTAPTA